MNLTSDFPYWLLKNGLQRSYPELQQDTTCDVAVIGCGITGALLADRFSREGYDTVVVDRRDVCTGSTSASTALLQYEIDVPLIEMQKLIGESQANQAYRLSHQSIDHLETLARTLDTDIGFRRKTSIWFADSDQAAEQLAREAEARQAIGLDATFHNRQQVSKNFGLDGQAAISTSQAASVDPYRFAHALLTRAQQNGARIFDRVTISDTDYSHGVTRLSTQQGLTIFARHVVYATGYESQSMLREKVVDLDNTYALVSEPLDQISPWDRDWLMWEAKTPYLYLRITADNRLLVGGEDDRYHDPERRDRSIPQKTEIIEEKVRKLIPNWEWKPAYRWAGTFGRTKDGLAYIGPTAEYPGALFALCFGGNGITFSCIAADLLSDFLKSGTSPSANLFRFGRW